jgi:hypothetical protein
MLIILALGNSILFLTLYLLSCEPMSNVNYPRMAKNYGGNRKPTVHFTEPLHIEHPTSSTKTKASKSPEASTNGRHNQQEVAKEFNRQQSKESIE